MFRQALQCMAVLAVLIAACTPTVTPVAPTAPPASATPPPPALTGKISFMVFGGPEEKAAYETVVAAFQQKFPAVEVQLLHIPSQSDYRKRVAADLIGGTPADVVIFNFRRFAEFAAKDGLEPLDAYLGASKTIKASDFYPQALNAFAYQGKQYCIPQNISSLVVYYNRNLFDEAKLPYPKAGWTWDEFVATARALTKAEKGQYGVWVEPSLIRVAPFIWQNGGQVVDNEAAPTRLTLDTPEAKAALEWYVALQTVEHVAPDATAEQSQAGQDRFSAGLLGMFLDSRRTTTAFRSITGFDWDVAPLPQAKQSATMLHADGFCIPAASQNKAAAWALIEYLGSAEGQTVLSGTGRIVPSVKSVAESPAFLDPNAKPANSKVWLDAIPSIHIVPVIPQWAEVEDKTNAEIERAFYGNASVDEALQAITERTTPVFGP